MTKEEKELRALLDRQKEHWRACEDAVQAAKSEISETTVRLNRIEKEKKRNAKLTPAMLAVLTKLAQEGAYLTKVSKWEGGHFIRLNLPGGTFGEKIPGHVFGGLLSREVIQVVDESVAAFYQKSARYVISERGRAKIKY